MEKFTKEEILVAIEALKGRKKILRQLMVEETDENHRRTYYVTKIEQIEARLLELELDLGEL
jgi:hypothetical protein